MLEFFYAYERTEKRTVSSLSSSISLNHLWAFSIHSRRFPECVSTSFHNSSNRLWLKFTNSSSSEINLAKNRWSFRCKFTNTLWSLSSTPLTVPYEGMVSPLLQTNSFRRIKVIQLQNVSYILRSKMQVLGFHGSYSPHWFFSFINCYSRSKTKNRSAKPFPESFTKSNIRHHFSVFVTTRLRNSCQTPKLLH